MALGSSNRSHVPFRQSKLTAILKDSLGGNSKTTMIANLWPEERHLEETTSTLKFAVRMMRVQTDPTVNVLLDPATHIKQLQRQIADLKSELQMQNQLHGKSHIVYDGEIGDDERFEMEKVVKSYIAGKVADIPVRSLREVKEFFRIFKACVDQRDAEVGVARAVTSAAQSAAPEASLKAAPPPGARRSSISGDAGALDSTTGVSVGVAAPAKSLKELTSKASPPRGLTSASLETPRNASGSNLDLSPDSVSGSARGLGQPPAQGSVVLPDRSGAFTDFKRNGEGLRLAIALKDQQQQLADKRKVAADLSVAVNEIKVHIDAAQQELAQRRQDRFARGEEELVDDEEFELVKRAKEYKAEYRRLYDELATTKTARDHLSRLVDHSKQQLLTAFDAWYERMFGSLTADPETMSAPGGAGLKAVRGRAGKPRGGMDDDDQLDEGERFEQLELQRVMEDDPESVDYYRAKKMTAAKQAQMKRTVPVGNTGAAARRR
jgi:kinesin family protein 6/9